MGPTSVFAKSHNSDKLPFFMNCQPNDTDIDVDDDCSDEKRMISKNLLRIFSVMFQVQSWSTIILGHLKINDNDIYNNN